MQYNSHHYWTIWVSSLPLAYSSYFCSMAPHLCKDALHIFYFKHTHNIGPGIVKGYSNRILYIPSSTIPDGNGVWGRSLSDHPRLLPPSPCDVTAPVSKDTNSFSGTDAMVLQTVDWSWDVVQHNIIIRIMQQRVCCLYNIHTYILNAHGRSP